MSAYRQLGTLPADAQAERPERQATATSVPAAHLNVRGPLALGLAMILLVVVAGLGARHTRLSDLAELTGVAIFETKVTTLHAEEGPAARVHIAPGAQVKTGDLLLTRDTSELDRQIAMLKALAEAARSQLALVGQEAAAMPAPGALLDSDRPKLASLEQRIAELEKESAELTQRLALAERELARSQLRSPVSGRVVALNVHGADAARASGLVDLQIVTADRPLLYRLLDPVRRSRPPTSTAKSVADLEKDP
jgi:multidrug resistance efflux pump